MIERVIEHIETDIGRFKIELIPSKSGKKWAWAWTSPNKWRSGGSLGHPFNTVEEAREFVTKEIADFVENEQSGMSGVFLIGNGESKRIEP